MSFEIQIISVAAATLLGTVASFISSILAERERKRKEKEIEHIRAISKKSFSAYFEQLKKTQPDIELGDNWSEIIEEFYTASVTETAHAKTLPEEEIQKIIDRKVNHLKDRIEEIEKRFPSQDTVEKIETVTNFV